MALSNLSSCCGKVFVWRFRRCWECSDCKIAYVHEGTKPYPRTRCCVPFCSRTSTLFSQDWICADHWRLVPRTMKATRTRLVRRWKRNGRWETSGPAVNNVLNRLWRRMKAAAITRATGLD